MYFLTDICFLCLKNNIKVKSVLTEDTDGIVVNVKLRCFFPEIIDSTPDTHKLACLECLEKLRISYDFRQLVVRNNTIFKDYTDKLKCQQTSYEQLSVVLPRSKHQTIDSFTTDFTANDTKHSEMYDSNNLKLQNENLNLTSTNRSCQLNTNENDVFFSTFSCQTKEIHNLKIENIEIEELHIKEELHIIEELNIKEEWHDEDDFSRNNLDEGSKESEDPNSTSSQSEYNDERTTKEAKKRRFKCRECPKAFTDQSNLKRHKRLHTEERRVKCQICQKTLNSNNSLERHKLTHTGEKPHFCDICQKSFNRKSNLLIHKRSHDNVRPYQCSVCKKTFSQTSNLTTHMYIHSGQKPYHCDICQYKCTKSDNLKKHFMRTHTAKRPYPCKYCRKSYAWPSDLKGHIKKHHIEEDA